MWEKGSEVDVVRMLGGVCTNLVPVLLHAAFSSGRKGLDDVRNQVSKWSFGRSFFPPYSSILPCCAFLPAFSSFSKQKKSQSLSPISILYLRHLDQGCSWPTASGRRPRCSFVREALMLVAACLQPAGAAAAEMLPGRAYSCQGGEVLDLSRPEVSPTPRHPATAHQQRWKQNMSPARNKGKTKTKLSTVPLQSRSSCSRRLS